MNRLIRSCLFLFFCSLITGIRSLSSDTITLKNGNKMPLIGFGTHSLEKNEESENTIFEAIKVGYRKFDTAFQYDNEESLGSAIKKAIQEEGLKREDFFVTTKIWNTFHSKDLVERQMKLSLLNLDLDYVDLLLMNHPTGFEYPGKSKEKTWFPKFENGTIKPSSWNTDDWVDTYKGMEAIFNKGQAKALGVSNFNVRQIDKLMQVAEVKPQLNQIESNVFYQNSRIVNHCLKSDVRPEAYAPLHPDTGNEQVIKDLSKKYNKTPSQVALRWLLERGLSVNVKTSKKERMEENLDVFNFNLTKDEVNDIMKIQHKEKKFTLKGSEDHPDYPFKEPSEEEITTTTTTTTTPIPSSTEAAGGHSHDHSGHSSDSKPSGESVGSMLCNLI